ncbi:cytosolic 5'-nucleotidase 1A isoform X2 [Siniperca chuatsi]|uniref:cytosolic 5'-nucleotidase 1A isoform X2 n=1 Tax=Siniperca chuatsi TaxID=119488 RepID=UPI001CE068DD|nr:cytosolic 5'-nucleotidase 1A isoform X2 [Siniperca chuatsi]XP_044048802.1 cytosolic 5'-nucleotidase 1A isoform X2 [Siniperca chuatsi]
MQDLSPLQKDADRAVVVAVTSRALFKCGADDGGEVYGEGVAFPLLQALQRVNERLLEENPAESLLFDVILITTNSQQQQQSSRIISSTRHYGLEVGRFCFSSEEDFIKSLLKNNVQLFLSTDRNEAQRASQKGVLSALLDQQTAFCPSEQLRVMFCGDAVIRPDTGPMPASRQAAQSFSAQLGKMRGRFSMLESPLSIVLVTSRGGRESCGGALRALRSRGLSVDEAYSLAGAPRGPILSVLRPHFLLSDGFSSLEE